MPIRRYSPHRDGSVDPGGHSAPYHWDRLENIDASSGGTIQIDNRKYKLHVVTAAASSPVTLELRVAPDDPRFSVNITGREDT